VGEVRVAKTGPAEHVAEVEVAHAGGRAKVSGSAFRLAVGPSLVRATRFRIEDLDGGGLRIRGRGWGHAVGLCQIGARGMARAGHDAEGILRHYYPGADLVRLYERAAP
jgi:stage II sporulation protein D